MEEIEPEEDEARGTRRKKKKKGVLPILFLDVFGETGLVTPGICKEGPV